MVVVDARFPRLLRDLRHDRGLSLRELSTRVHHSHSYLWDIETGRRQPTPDIAQTLDDALAADGILAELVTESPAGEPVDHAPIAAAMHLLDTTAATSRTSPNRAGPLPIPARKPLPRSGRNSRAGSTTRSSATGRRVSG
jgi:transcriptional regulator with XRE-family HTH domain